MNESNTLYYCRYYFVVCRLITHSYQRRVELRHLRYFAAVAHTLNFRRAAEQLHLSQPALSKQIKDLESEIGVQLLNRNTGGVSLTDAGNAFWEEALEILERVEMAVDIAREAQSGKRGRLNIGNLGAMSGAFLPNALSRFRAAFPKVEVTLNEISLQDQHNELKSGRIQIGFTIVRSIDPHFDSLEILRSKMHVALSPAHPYASQPCVPLSELTQEQFLCMGETERHELHRRRIKTVLSNRGIHHHTIKRVSSIGSLFTLVASNHGISLTLPLFNPTSEVIFRPIAEDGDDLEVRLYATWLKDTKSQLAKNFVATLRSLKKTSNPLSNSADPKPAF